MERFHSLQTTCGRSALPGFVCAILALAHLSGILSPAAAQAPKPLNPPPKPTPIDASGRRVGAAPSVAPSVAPSAARPLTVTDIVAMHQAGLGERVIVESIHQNRMASTLGAAELISMRRLGISNDVIQTMQQQAPLPAARPAPPASVQYQASSDVFVRPTIVEPVVRPVIVAPPIYGPIYRPIYHPHYYHVPVYRGPVRRHHHSSSFGIHVRF